MLRAQRFVMTSGERYVSLIDERTRLPHYASNLYITTQVRNASLSCAAMIAAAGHLTILYRFFAIRNIDWAVRCASGEFLYLHEVDALRDFLSYRFRKWDSCTLGQQMFTVEELLASHGTVHKDVLYSRMTTASRYILWFGRRYFDHLRPEPEALKNLSEQINALRPSHRGRNQELKDRALSDRQRLSLARYIEVGAAENPFDSTVQVRNRLMVTIESELGIRGGELLNIRVSDCNFATNTLLVARRPDQKDDPRPYQPLVKTRERRLPVSSELMAEIHDYILGARRAVRNASRCPYLFVTHKNGPSVGQPLSISAYQKMWDVLQSVVPELRAVTGHRLRHSWNHDFSTEMDALPKPPSPEDQEQIRSRWMGWKEGSGTASLYNRRFIQAKANEAGLMLQRTSRAKTGGEA
ncbi:tyrosine-type recombinase/integrase [Pseudomonas fluorescens]|uniref:tyrosine-type recombinase/integrase n=1 Tax=Pseudomonas fluorescens TaxID=294 RepID=UPI003749AD37